MSGLVNAGTGIWSLWFAVNSGPELGCGQHVCDGETKALDVIWEGTRWEGWLRRDSILLRDDLNQRAKNARLKEVFQPVVLGSNTGFTRGQRESNGHGGIPPSLDLYMRDLIPQHRTQNFFQLLTRSAILHNVRVQIWYAELR